jgi:hypothetical protein
MPSAIKPGIYDETFADETLEIKTEDAREMVARLAREEGLFVGISSGAAAVAALRVAERLDEGVVVTVFPDSGDKYLSDKNYGSLRNSALSGATAKSKRGAEGEGNMLKISNDLLVRINAHLEAAYPDEGAGFLLGEEGEVKEILTSAQRA